MKHKLKPGDLVITKGPRLAFMGIFMSLRERYAEPKNIELAKIYIISTIEPPDTLPRKLVFVNNTIEEINIKRITHATPGKYEELMMAVSIRKTQ
jgi:hypothetical protein